MSLTLEARQIFIQADLQDFLSIKNPLIVDLRTKSDFDRGHLDGARHLDFLHQNVESFFEGVDRNKSVLLYCSNGTRCKSMIRLLSAYGFVDLHFVDNGIGLWFETMS